jgi:hypothetical protein
MDAHEKEEKFHYRMRGIYDTAKEDCNYNATYFLQMVESMGGLAAAKQLLSADVPQYGFTKLWECGRLDLTVEALALEEEFKNLFGDEEIKTSRRRLERYGYRLKD